jgi:multiple sugar transport system ATP-binding protein
VDVTEVREAAGDEDAALVAVEGSLFTARVHPGTAARPGAQLRLAVDPARFHYFDPETGLRRERDRRPVATAAG